MPDDLQLNDPVFVRWSPDGESTSKDLEGIVAYKGAVAGFADPMMGIRLTGKSIGQGQHDGTVENERYFEAPALCGIFAIPNAVRSRNLTKLEELRLRRELAAASTSTPAATTTTMTPSRSTAMQAVSTTTPAVEASAPSTISTSSSKTDNAAAAATTSNASTMMSRIEELRQRRAALQQSRKDEGEAGGLSSPLKTAFTPRAASTSTTGSFAPRIATSKEVEALKQQLEDVQNQLQQAQQETTALQAQLAESQDQLQQSQHEVSDLQTKLLHKERRTPEKTKTITTASTQISIEELQGQNLRLQSEKDELIDRLEELTHDLAELKQDKDRLSRSHDELSSQLVQVRAEASGFQQELQSISQKSNQRIASDASHYKERAKLQAEIAALQRKIQDLQTERVDFETTIEDLTLDKEQLLQEKEQLDEKLEEMKLDAETAQMELEELKMELEYAKAAAAEGSRSESTSHPLRASDDPDNNDMVEALQSQNARLREALIRLREQTSLEKMEWTRQLRTLEKEASTNTAILEEHNQLAQNQQHLQEQIQDLKDMVEQGAAFESMVEDLSDRVMALEEEIMARQNIIRDLEEAAELTAEMEEVQAEELKAMAADLEGRDTIIRNMEEAIKMYVEETRVWCRNEIMPHYHFRFFVFRFFLNFLYNECLCVYRQRRREEDFRRTVSNYKTTVETLKQEKAALLEMQQGGEGEKSHLIASSQKALAKAAQLVKDAAEMRKREAQAVLDRIERDTFCHWSTRLESMLPQVVASAELSAMKGELLAAKIIGKASKTLQGIFVSFSKTIRPSLPALSEETEAAAEGSLSDMKISDEAQQKIATMFHQTEFACEIIDISSCLIRLLSAGQWPDLLSPEASTELGSILGHSLPELDNSLGFVLKSLKEEGALTVDQSNIGSLRLSVQNTMQMLRSDIEREDDTLLPSNWNPPGMQLLHDASLSKFNCHGAASALCVVMDDQLESSCSRIVLGNIYSKVEACSQQSANAFLRVANLDLRNEPLVERLTASFFTLAEKSKRLLDSIHNVTLGGTTNVQICGSEADKLLRELAGLTAFMRSENMNPTEDERCHPLCPEVDDAWDGIVSVVRVIRSIDSDADDINCLLRAESLERRLAEAVENEPKLTLANSKIVDLEKVCTLVLRVVNHHHLPHDMSLNHTASTEFVSSIERNRNAKCSFV